MGRVVLRAEGDVFPTATAHRVGRDRHVDVPLLNDPELLAGDDRNGIDAVGAVVVEDARGDLPGEIDLEPLDVTGVEVAGGEPERVLVDADEQAAALADLVERAPVGRSVVRPEALRRELLLDAPTLARRRRRGGRRGRSAGLGDWSAPSLARGERREPPRCPIAVGSEQAPSIARRRQANGSSADQRNSRNLGCSPMTMAIPAPIVARTTRMGSTTAKSRARSASSINADDERSISSASSASTAPAAVGLAIHGNVDGGEVVAAVVERAAPHHELRGTRRIGASIDSRAARAGPVGCCVVGAIEESIRLADADAARCSSSKSSM